MKFDVVVGNPPYQGDKNNCIWKDFTKLVISLNPQVICFITPRAILNGAKFDNQNLFLSLNDHLKYIQYVHKDIFKVGKMIAAWVYDTSFCNTTEIVLENAQTVHMDVSTLKFMPYNITDVIGLAIANKLIEYANDKNLQENYEIFSNSLSGLVIPKNKHMSLRHRFITNNKNNDATIKSKQIYFLPFGKTDHIFDYIDHPIFKFLWSVLGISDGLGGTFFRKIPYVDLSRSWTDQELYEHFNLTQEEIDYIESTVK